ncbi:hypothetical protein KI429_12860 [Pseudomonas shirazica]|nr:hypothetical protein KI429_12860 [Pseudomonas shirazica]
MDGQQRLTAGIHLLYATGPRQYYIHLDRLLELCNAKQINFEIKDEVIKFVHDLDETDGYLIARQRTNDPRSLLVKRHLLCTSILADATELSLAILDYLHAYPERTNFAYRLVVPFLVWQKLTLSR